MVAPEVLKHNNILKNDINQTTIRNHNNKTEDNKGTGSAIKLQEQQSKHKKTQLIWKLNKTTNYLRKRNSILQNNKTEKHFR